MTDPTATLFRPFDEFVQTLGECFAFIKQKDEERLRMEIANHERDEYLTIVVTELNASLTQLLSYFDVIQNKSPSR